MAPPINQPPGNQNPPGTVGGPPAKNAGGKNTWKSIQAKNVRKYWFTTSQISLSTWASVPAKIKKIEIAKSATVSLSDVSGISSRRATSPAERVLARSPERASAALCRRANASVAIARSRHERWTAHAFAARRAQQVHHGGRCALQLDLLCFGAQLDRIDRRQLQLIAPAIHVDQQVLLIIPLGFWQYGDAHLE